MIALDETRDIELVNKMWGSYLRLLKDLVSVACFADGNSGLEWVMMRSENMHEK